MFRVHYFVANNRFAVAVVEILAGGRATTVPLCAQGGTLKCVVTTIINGWRECVRQTNKNTSYLHVTNSPYHNIAACCAPMVQEQMHKCNIMTV